MDQKTAKPRELTHCEPATVVGGVSPVRSTIAQALAIGSQSSGAGAGEITFNQF
jgi:hypothetical protein